jgi:hypothetical protein
VGCCETDKNICKWSEYGLLYTLQKVKECRCVMMRVQVISTLQNSLCAFSNFTTISIKKKRKFLHKQNDTLIVPKYFS